MTKRPSNTPASKQHGLYIEIHVDVREALQRRKLVEGATMNKIVEKALRQYLGMAPIGHDVIHAGQSSADH